MEKFEKYLTTITYSLTDRLLGDPLLTCIAASPLEKSLMVDRVEEIIRQFLLKNTKPYKVEQHLTTRIKELEALLNTEIEEKQLLKKEINKVPNPKNFQNFENEKKLKFQKLEDELIITKSDLVTKDSIIKQKDSTIKDLKMEVSKLQKSEENLEIQIEKLREDLNNKKEIQKISQKNIEEKLTLKIQKEFDTKIHKILEDQTSKINFFETQRANFEEKIEEKKKIISRLLLTPNCQTLNYQLKMSNLELTKDNYDLKFKLDGLQSDNETLKAQNGKKLEEIGQKNSKILELKNQIDSLDIQLGDKELIIQTLEVDNQTIQAELSIQKAKVKFYFFSFFQVSNLQEEVKKLVEELNSKDNKLNSILQRFHNFRSKLDSQVLDTQKQLKNMLEKHEVLKKEKEEDIKLIQELKIQLDCNKERLEVLESKNKEKEYKIEDLEHKKTILEKEKSYLRTLKTPKSITKADRLVPVLYYDDENEKRMANVLREI